MAFFAEIECVGILGLVARLSGQLEREGDKRLAAVERLIAEAGKPEGYPDAGAHEAELL